MSHQQRPESPFSTDSTHQDSRFRLLVESVQDYAIFILDTEGRIQTWNAGAQRLKGYVAEEVIGQPLEIFYPAEAVERAWPREELARATELGRFEDEGWRVRKDGSRFWANVVITALRDPQGGLIGFAKVTRDLTERKHQEEAVRRSEEQFRLLMESVKDYAIFMLDPHGRILTWNAGARAIKGYAAEEVMGRSFTMFFTAQDVAANVPQRELISARLHGRAEAEGWRVRKDGTVFWANVVITPVLGKDGALQGFVKVTRDLTEQRRLLELEQSSQRLHEFLAMLAHELRNPLAPMRNASDLMKIYAPLPQPLVRAREIIDRQLTHLTRLIDDLLDVGRIAHGKIVLKSESIDFRDVVTASIEAIRPLVDSRSQRLDVELPQAPVAMTADATRLVQALQNLLNNASRYTEAGGEIRVTVRIESSACITAVSDSGYGIAPEALERIFDLFGQEDTPRLHADSGLGVGLSLARRLVEQHGGMLSAFSEGLGRGSTFTMLLPLGVGSGEAGQQPASEDQVVRAPSCRVLVVDDNRDSTDTMVALLEMLGHEVRGVYGADDALRVAQELRPHLVLLDLNMPDGDGFSVLRQLRKIGQEPMYVAAMTGYGHHTDQRRTLEAGFQMHLTKPVGIEQLQKVLTQAEKLRVS